MGNRAVIFDLDGTLADTLGDILNAVNRMREFYRLGPLSRDQVRLAIGNGAAVLVQRVLGGAPESIDRTEALTCYNRCYMEKLAVNTLLFPGVREGLARLRGSGYKLAVSSNKPDNFCKVLLDNLGIGEVFDFIAGGRPGIPAKPAPDSLLLALKALDCEASSSWMCGDNYTDLRAGRTAGTKVIFCTYGYGDPKGEVWDFAAESFAGAVDFICREQRV